MAKVKIIPSTHIPTETLQKYKVNIAEEGPVLQYGNHFGEIDLRKLTPEICDRLIAMGFPHITKIDDKTTNVVNA
ncbi:MAG: hypothetical protein LCH44_13950 [Bacteroidetes bacterium]|jgi:hypothetical protein|nr:hypothetical protein [Bacteroidota bacterium]